MRTSYNTASRKEIKLRGGLAIFTAVGFEKS
jgi:hypothetical protein